MMSSGEILVFMYFAFNFFPIFYSYIVPIVYSKARDCMFMACFVYFIQWSLP